MTKITYENRNFILKEYDKACRAVDRLEKKLPKCSTEELDQRVKEYSIACAKKKSLQDRVNRIDAQRTVGLEDFTTNTDGHGCMF